MEDIYEAEGVIVAKVGSSTLVDGQGRPDRPFISSLCEQASVLERDGYHVVIVSSGATACGMERLGLKVRPRDMPGRQACAAAGQAALTEIYAECLQRRGIACGQVLLTRRDLADRDGYLNARNTLGRMLELGVIPVVNENDTVSFTEYNFGDNDMLGAIVATMLGADLYVILSDVDGLYDHDPAHNPAARLLDRVCEVTPEVSAMAGGAGSALGTGGMASKVLAGRAMLAAGIPMVICRGREKDALVRVVDGEALGTRFEAPGNAPHESARKLWIGLAEMPRGSITLDAGATRAVLERGASILPVGVTTHAGQFMRGDVVDVLSSAGTLIGRGVSRYSSDEVERVRGLKLSVIARFMPEHDGQPVIHRDELLVL